MASVPDVLCINIGGIGDLPGLAIPCPTQHLEAEFTLLDLHHHHARRSAPNYYPCAYYLDLAFPWPDSVTAKISSLTQDDGKAHATDGLVQNFHRDSARIFETRRNTVSVDV